MNVVPLHRIDGSVEELSDEALVVACAAGERAALGALYDRHATTLRRFLARMVRTNDRDLDDLVQTTFEMVVRAAPKFDRRSAVRTWLFGIANNTARHHVRSEGRRQRLRDAAVVEPREHSSDGGRVVDDRERAALLHRAIDELPPKLREVLVLVYLEGLSGAEAAQVTGVREGAVWKRLHEARACLRDAMRGVEP